MLLRGDSTMFVEDGFREPPPFLAPRPAAASRHARKNVTTLPQLKPAGAIEMGIETLYEQQQEVQDTEIMKITHFNSFFAEKWHIRRQLERSISKVLITLVEGMRMLVKSKVWFKCFWSVKLHINLKVSMRMFKMNHRKEREQLLNGMLRYWQSQEKKKAAVVRKSVQEVALTCPEKSRSRASAYSTIFTPDNIKVHLLWELYWLLRSQLSRNRSIYLRERRALSDARKQALVHIEENRAGARESLAHTNAGLFILFLRIPKMGFTPKDVPYSTLVQLAKTFTSPEHSLVPSCKIFDHFLTLPVCNSAAWFQKRIKLPHNLVPPQYWDPLGTVRLASAMVDDDSDSDDMDDEEAVVRSPLPLNTSGSMMLSCRRGSGMALGSYRRASLNPAASFLQQKAVPALPNVGSKNNLAVGSLAQTESSGVRTPNSGLRGRKDSMFMPPRERKSSVFEMPPVQGSFVRTPRLA